MSKSAAWILVWLAFAPMAARAQIDPVKRELFQFGYNQPLVGHSPLSGYAFYYRNEPDFPRTNLTLRLALAPVYLDSELGYRGALGEHTDLGVGLAGGGFADSYSEIRRGNFLPQESFVGHGGEVSLSVYHLFNPGRMIPLNGVLRGTMQYSVFDRDGETDPAFVVPDDRLTFHLRSGLRWGGREPTLFPSLGMELSLWYEGQFRGAAGSYGFNGDRAVQPQSHLFWASALFAYTFPGLKHNLYFNVTAGTSVDADRFSAYRLGAVLPLVSEFPLTLPGYYYQEISAERFVLLGGNYSLPLDARQRWNFNVVGATAFVDYLPGLEQPGKQHSGVGAGILYKSPTEALKVVVGYAYGVDAIRGRDRGAHSVGVLFQLDWEQAKATLLEPTAPGRSRGLQRIIGIIGD